jgi:hypothetical protein
MSAGAAPLRRVSVHIDGDNIAASHASALLDLAKEQGDPDCLRVYGNVPKLPGWSDKPAFRLVHSGDGKNGADIHLALDALERALRGACDVVVIATSNGDLSHLAFRLREMGLTVVGAGEAKAPARFRAACSQFHQLGPNAEAPAPQPKPPAAVIAFNATERDRVVRDVIARNSNNGAGVLLSQLGPLLGGKDLRVKDFGHATWRAYFTRNASLFAIDPRGPDARVRFIQSGFGSRT